jgi:parallel beta-helix repeat protein
MSTLAARSSRYALARILAALILLIVAVPIPSISPFAPSAHAASTCEGWKGITSRKLQFTSDGVLHVVGCNETFTLSDIYSAQQNGTISHTGTLPTILEQVGASSDKVWMLDTNLVIEEGATLNLIGGSGGDVNWLRLKSSAAGIISILARNSTLVIKDTHVSSWDPGAGAPDTTTPGGPGVGGTKPRSFIRARSEYRSGRTGGPGNVCDTAGGRDYFEARMDIINSTVDHLGYYGAEAYGLTWKVYTTDTTLLPPASRQLYNLADVFGTIQNSTITQNYFGAYTFGSYCMNVSGNHFDNNIYYGFDPHDDSDALTATNNTFNNNGGHGFICSKFCDHTVLQNNVANGNHGNGLMLHDETDGAVVEGNTANNNGDSGLAVFDSYNATVRSNHFEGNNVSAIRLSVGASNNLFENNVLTGGSGVGSNVLYTFVGTDPTELGGPSTLRNNTFRGNTINGTGNPVVRMTSAFGTLIEKNTINASASLTTYQFIDGQNNTIRANTVSGQTSIQTVRSSTATISPNSTIADPQIGQPIVVLNSGTGAMTKVTDSRFLGMSGLTMTANTTGTSGTLTSASTTITPRDLAVKPSKSTVAIAISTWNTGSPFAKTWTETAASSPGTVNYTVGNLQANSCYQVKAGSTVVGRFKASGSGSTARISFAYSGSYPTGSALTFTVSATTQSCSGTQGEASITLSKTKSKYNGRIIATLAGFAPDSSITVKWQDGTTLATATADGSGNATAAFRTPLVPLGNYTVTATGGSASASTTLRVIPRIMIAPDTSGPVGFRFRVYFYGFVPGNRVQVQWYNTAGTSFDVMGTITIADNGRGTQVFFVPQNAELGKHLIRGKVIGVSRSASTTFTVTGPGAAEEPVGSPTPIASESPTVEASPPAEASPVVEPTEATAPEPAATETAVASPVAFSDDFESGTMDGWEPVAGMTVQQSAAYDGSYGVQATSSEGAMSAARRTLSTTQADLYYRVRFKVERADTAAYLLRVRTSDNSGILGVAISTGGTLGIFNQVTNETVLSDVTVSAGTWHELMVHINQAAGSVEVWFDTKPVPALTGSQALGDTPIGVVELGDTSTKRAFTIDFDDVAIDTAPIPSTFQPPVQETPTETAPPEPTAPAEPTVSAEPTGVPTDTPVAPTETPVPVAPPAGTPAA